MGGTTVDPGNAIRPPDDTLSIAQMNLMTNAGIGNLQNQNRLLGYAAGMPTESWQPDVWGEQGLQNQAGQVSAVNAFRNSQVENQNNPALAQMRRQIPQMISEDLNGGAQKRMDDWTRKTGLTRYLGSGASGTVRDSAFFDAATQEGEAFRNAQEQKAQNYVAANPQAPVGIDAGTLLKMQQGQQAQAMQGRQAQRAGVLGAAQGNAQATTDWINQLMATGSGAVNAHNSNWQNYQQAMLTNATNNAQSKNAATGALIGAGGSAVGAAVAACWVARATFGTKTDRWKKFRAAMFRSAPDWFISGYCRRGQKIAEIVESSPIAKMVSKVVLCSLERKWA